LTTQEAEIFEKTSSTISRNDDIIILPDCDALDQFECGVGKCVPHEKVCDGILDCENGLDEAECKLDFEEETLIDTFESINDEEEIKTEISFETEELEASETPNAFNEIVDGSEAPAKKSIKMPEESKAKSENDINPSQDDFLDFGGLGFRSELNLGPEYDDHESEMTNLFDSFDETIDQDEMVNKLNDEEETFEDSFTPKKEATIQNSNDKVNDEKPSPRNPKSALPIITLHSQMLPHLETADPDINGFSIELEVPLKENVPEISIAELLFNSLNLKAEEV